MFLRAPAFLLDRSSRPLFLDLSRLLLVDCPGIKIRENAIVGKDASARSTAVLEFKKMGYKGWKQMHQYGRRWAVEGFFSSIKRIFGETVRASSQAGMVSEVKRSFILYNILMNI